MSLQSFLEAKFERWQPAEPRVLNSTTHSVTLEWQPEDFSFLGSSLLYRLERKEKMPPWVIVYSGGKTSKTIEDLAPCSPHRFRLRVILRASAVPALAAEALRHYGNEEAIFSALAHIGLDEECYNQDRIITESKENVEQTDECIQAEEDAGRASGDGDDSTEEVRREEELILDGSGDDSDDKSGVVAGAQRWLQSRWSVVTWASTDSDGTSSACFCMAVRGGYLKQMQMMLDERPSLVGIINPTSGYTPLAIAVRKGDMATVRFLLCAGAELEQRSAAERTALHEAVLAARPVLADLLLERGADFQARDVNGMRVEHFAVESGSVATLRWALAQGGDVAARDNNGWTPLFRAVVQGASTEMVEELVLAGSDVAAVDDAGLGLPAAARLLTKRGRPRESLLRLVDAQYPHELALAHFTRLTKKISSVHTLFRG